MENFAVVKNGVVENIIVVEPVNTDFIATLSGRVILSGEDVAVGDDYDGANFSRQAVVKTQEELNQEILANIKMLEDAENLARPVREFMLLAAVERAAAQGVDEPTLYAANIAYKKVKDFDNQIATLRSQII